MKPPHGQLARFNIFPERGVSRLHYRVRVFRTVADMLAYLRDDEYPRPAGRKCKGMCSSWTRYPNGGHASPDLGEIVFAQHWMGAEIISHECTHAALGWARRIGLDVSVVGQGRFIEGGEERFCSVLGQLVRQVAVQAWKRGFVK